VFFRDNRLWVKGTQGAQMLKEVVVTATKRNRSYNDSAADFVHAAAPKSLESSFDEIVYTAEVFVDFSTVTDKTQ
jgi:hypothetical protein